MNRFLKLETIFFISIFSLFFTLSVEANDSGSKLYRDNFSNAPEYEEPAGKGEENEGGEDGGSKGGKTGKKKKKETDISIPPGAGNEGPLIITLEAKSAQLTSFSSNGFSEPGAPVILDPDSLSPISSDRSLFDQVRGEFSGEGGKVVVDENGIVEGILDPSIRQTVGIKMGQWMAVDPNRWGITEYKIPGAGPLSSRNPIAIVTGLSQIGEDAGYRLIFPMIGQMNPATALIPPGLVAQNAPKPRSYVLTESRVFLNNFLILYGATNMPGVTWRFNKNWELEKYINYEREGVSRATLHMGLTAAGLTGLGFVLRPFKKFIKKADDVAPAPDKLHPLARPASELIKENDLELVRELRDQLSRLPQLLNIRLGAGDHVVELKLESGERVIYFIKGNGEYVSAPISPAGGFDPHGGVVRGTIEGFGGLFSWLGQQAASGSTPGKFLTITNLTDDTARILQAVSELPLIDIQRRLADLAGSGGS